MNGRMLRATFQLTAGLGPKRERELWRAGLVDWSQLSQKPTEEPTEKLSIARWPATLWSRLRERAARAEAACRAGDLDTLGQLLPPQEHWRLYGTFAERAVYLDIECDPQEKASGMGGPTGLDGMAGITAIGLLFAEGPRLLLAGRDLGAFAELVPPSALLVTFNGACFDLPGLKRAFPDWRPPSAHLDLRPAWQRLGFHGGLKALEQQMGLGRPPHLRALDGVAACWLWRHGQRGNQEALVRFAEYNLYDVINLRPLAGLAYNALAAASGLDVPPVRVCYRGDVLYDVSKILLGLQNAPGPV